ncbi:MAG: ATP-binding protein [Lentisphaeraceae bacterium]|nr:ATP-binding protein [Lentisphaeraceae bacterium]
MFLKKVKFSQFEDSPKEWSLIDFCPLQINLVVGKNATGKTRTLNSISVLAHLISKDRIELPENASFDFTWVSGITEISYSLKTQNRKVLFEQLIINNEVKLKREAHEGCSIFFEKLGQEIEVSVPLDSLCCVVRRDELQHPWFEHLHNWASSTLHYRFGSVFGKNYGLLVRPDDDRGPRPDDEEIDLRRTDRVVELFQKGYEQYGQIFVSGIIESMKKISYNLEDIDIYYSEKMKFRNPSEIPPAVLRVKEYDLECHTYQADMSQGMFRALSLIIQLTLSRLISKPCNIIIDDIGEGLDYDRSTQLIRLLIDKTEKTSIQLIMSSNDRFIMNNVDLKYWSVIQRKGNKSMVFNSSNAKEAFDEFVFTGLSNFDFLCTEFYCKPIDDE